MDVEGNGDMGEWGQEGMGAWRGCGDTDTEKIRRQTQEDSEAWGHRHFDIMRRGRGKELGEGVDPRTPRKV